MNTKLLMIYILSVVATLACSLFAGWSVRDNCGEWLSLTLLIGAGVALLMQLYFLIKAVRAGHLWTSLVVAVLIALSAIVGAALFFLSVFACGCPRRPMLIEQTDSVYQQPTTPTDSTNNAVVLPQ